MYNAHGCTAQFQPDIRKDAAWDAGVSKEVDFLVGAAERVENGGVFWEAAF